MLDADAGTALDARAEPKARPQADALAALFDVDLKVLSATPGFMALIGAEAESHVLLGTLPVSWAKACQCALQGSAVRILPETILDPSGKERIISAIAQPWNSPRGGIGVALVCADETELGALQRANEIAIENLRIATRAAHCGIWRLDLKTKSVWVTPEYEEIMGMGLAFEDLVSPNPGWLFEEDIPLYREFLRELSGPVGRASIEHRLAASPQTWIHATCERICGLEGEAHAFVGMARNITERKRAELELINATRRASQSLEEKRTILHEIFKDLGVVAEPEPYQTTPTRPAGASGISELTTQFLRLSSELANRDAILVEAIDVLRRSRAEEQKASAAKSQFLLTMTHELRTPLNAIIGYSELAREDAHERGDVAGARDMERVLAAAGDLRGMVESILDLTKLEAGDLAAEALPFDAAQTAREAAESMRARAAENHNELFVDAGYVGQALGDSRRFAECLTHLLSNACKFTSNGRITLRMRRDAGGRQDVLLFEVSDTGIGIAPAQLDNLFQPFAQVDATKTRAYGGAGVGLAVARGIARLMGGDISVLSEPGHGSTFTLSLPAASDSGLAAA
jgi:signal transduction histidine kinase